MNVELKHTANPDVAGGYWGGFVPSVNNIIEQVATLEEASRACRRFIEEHELGGGNWAGGNVYDGGKLVASVSYNGRVWLPGNEYFESRRRRMQTAIVFEGEQLSFEI